jgi:hypothetical protein
MAQTIFEQLAPYAGMTVVPGVTVGRLNYANQQDSFSDAAFSTTLQVVNANTELQFFTSAIAETGQGWSTGLSLTQTNSKFSKGQPPANQCLVSTHLGVALYVTNDLSPAGSQDITLLSVRDTFSILQNFSWDLQIGRGITRTIGSLLEYPAVGGAWSTTSTTGGNGSAQNGVPACHTVKLPIPIIFPPLVNVGLTAKCGNAFSLQDVSAQANTNIVVRLTLGGFLMTMPV